MKSALIAVAVVVVLAVSAGSADAQLLDHLKCHKMKDPLHLKATVDLAALQSQFSASGCTLGKAKMFCVPVTKSNVQPPDAAPLDINGDQLQTDFICYSAKCTETLPASNDASDQFGGRTQTTFRTKLVCAPAIMGTVTTTTSAPGATTTTTQPGTSCGAAAFPECNGACGAGSVCADIGSNHCGCIGGAPGCGVYQGPPTCSGTCSGAGTPWCKDVGGTCVCSATP